MQLRIQYTDGREQVISCDAHRTLRFGTRRSADVPLEGGGIFPIHFGVLLHHGVFTVVASEQARKIRVNGTRVHEAALQVGDRIEVGELVVLVEADETLLADVPGASAQGLAPQKSGQGKVWLARLGLGCALLPLALLLGVYVGQMPTADELRQTAEDAYREEDYARAVERYDVYLRAVSHSPESHVARTRRQLADWLSRRDGELDAAALVADMQAAAADWTSDDNVSVSDALSQLLPPAVRDLTQQAQVAVSSGNVAAANSALSAAQAGIDLLRKYVAHGRLQAVDAAQLQADVLRIQRPLLANDALQKTLVALDEAAAKADWSTARAQHEALLNAHPQWNRDGRLRDALQQVSARLATRVEVLEPGRDVNPPPSDTGSWKARVQLVGSLPKAPVEPPATPDRAGLLPRCIVIPSSGVVIGVDAGSGRLLSRTAIGLAGPNTVCELGEGDCLVVHAIKQDVRRVDLATGEVKWRSPLRADALSVTRDGKQGVVLSRPDVVSLISLVDGALVWQCRLPQPVEVCPIADPDMAVCYVVADESQVYSLSAESGAGLSVCAAGHRRGSVWTPPITVGEYLLFVEQWGTELSVVHVLRRGTELQAVQTLEMAGTLSGPLQQSGEVVYLPFERGVVGRLRLDAAEKRKPFTVVDAWNMAMAKGRTPGSVQLTCVGDRMCVVDQGLRVFRAPADGSLPVSMEELESDFVGWGPVSLRGDCLVAVGSPAESLVPQVRAWDLATSKGLWSIPLGVSKQVPVSATTTDEALQIVCGEDRFVVPAPSLLSTAGPLPCIEPTKAMESASSHAAALIAPAVGAVEATGRQDILGRSFAIEPEGLACYDSDQKLQWRIWLSSERMIGLCASGDEELAVADVAGHVWRIGVANGEIRQQLVDVGEPLMAGPWWIASHLVVLSRDGCVLVWE